MPVRPIVLLEKLSMGEAHGAACVVEDVSGFKYVLGWGFLEVVCNCREVPVVVKLIVNVLSERG